MSAAIPVVTLDGPGGAGKGTVCRALAKQLGWHYLDSGAIYRSLAVAVADRGVALDDINQIESIAASLDLSFASGLRPCVQLSGVDITTRIATEACGDSASRLAALPGVRRVLLQKQRDFRASPGLIADGRDMGTVVFQDAPCKIFLTATAEVRAERRYRQLKEKGLDVNLADLTIEIELRDKRDRERKEAPLLAAEDAVQLDSSELTVEQVIARCLQLIEAKIPGTVSSF